MFKGRDDAPGRTDHPTLESRFGQDPCPAVEQLHEICASLDLAGEVLDRPFRKQVDQRVKRFLASHDGRIPFLFRQLQHWAEHGHPGPEPTFEERVDTMVDHFHRLVDARGERNACFQFRKIIKWYSHSIRPPKALYHRLINLASVALFDETVEEIRSAGPSSPLPGHFEPRVPVPAGPIDKW